MSLWNDMPQITSPPQTSDLSVVLDYVKKLANTTAKMAKDLEFILNGNVAFDNIRVNGIEAHNIKAGAITAEKIDVEELSAISANLGHIIAGLIESVSIYGSLIATSRYSYPRAEMSNTENTFGAYMAPDNNVKITSSTDLTMSPGVSWNNGISSFSAGLNGREMKLTGGDTSIVAISALLKLVGNIIELAPNDSITIPSWNMIKDSSGVSASAGFAARGRQTKLSSVFNCGIPIGAQIMLAGGGTATWMGVPEHSHTQD